MILPEFANYPQTGALPDSDVLLGSCLHRARSASRSKSLSWVVRGGRKAEGGKLVGAVDESATGSVSFLFGDTLEAPDRLLDRPRGEARPRRAASLRRVLRARAVRRQGVRVAPARVLGRRGARARDLVGPRPS